LAHDYAYIRPSIHPLHAILLSFPIAFFTSALWSDIAYLKTAEIQWTNFSQWLIVGGLVFGAVVLLWGLLSWRRRRAGLAYVILLLAMCVFGLINAFQHSKDAWSSVGTTGLLLSIISTLCALAAGWIAFRGTGASS
jgi:uncharacterized membrane protein